MTKNELYKRTVFIFFCGTIFALNVSAALDPDTTIPSWLSVIAAWIMLFALWSETTRLGTTIETMCYKFSTQTLREVRESADKKIQQAIQQAKEKSQ